MNFNSGKTLVKDEQKTLYYLFGNQIITKLQKTKKNI